MTPVHPIVHEPIYPVRTLSPNNKGGNSCASTNFSYVLPHHCKVTRCPFKYGVRRVSPPSDAVTHSHYRVPSYSSFLSTMFLVLRLVILRFVVLSYSLSGPYLLLVRRKS